VGKGTIYEGGIRVCAFASWPGKIPAGKTVSEPLQGVDWYPTLLKLAGGKLEQTLPLDGRDIWPVLTEGAKSPHDTLLICATKRGDAALRIGDWKLVHAGNKDELYNLASDLGETKDLASSQPEKLKELRAKLDTLKNDAAPAGGGDDETTPAKAQKKKKK
jgi:arylsulfatase A-like enzyme